jgi:hypothetical protein
MLPEIFLILFNDLLASREIKDAPPHRDDIGLRLAPIDAGSDFSCCFYLLPNGCDLGEKLFFARYGLAAI